MCGIAGMIGIPSGDVTVEKMLATMSRRGPDSKGLYRNADTVLLHARLSIIDPEGGRQPMALSYGAETYIIVYNGELYNTVELRKTLQSCGHSFLGHSDTEVLLHAYAQYGENCLEHLNGIFSFAVWEENRKRLFLARDRIGVKPLFFCQPQGGLLFSSEMKTLLAHPSVKARLDETVYGEAAEKFQLEGLYQLLQGRKKDLPEGSYTTYLFQKGLDKILKKVGEECTEVIIAGKADDKAETIYEIADLTYHVMVLMVQMGISVEDIRKELASRHVLDHKVKQEKMTK